jgi:hypothetical protein
MAFQIVKKSKPFFTQQNIGKKRVKKSPFPFLLRSVKMSLRNFFTQARGLLSSPES